MQSLGHLIVPTNFSVEFHLDICTLVPHCYLYTHEIANEYINWLNKLHIGWPLCPSKM